MSVVVVADMICVELLMCCVGPVVASRRQPLTHNVSASCRLIGLGVILLTIMRGRTGVRMLGAGMRDGRDQFHSNRRL